MQIVASLKLQDIICVAPAIILFLASLSPLTLKVLRKNEEPHPGMVLALVFIGVIGAMASSALLFARQTGPYFAFSNALVFDGVSVVASMIISILVGFVAVMARENKATNGEHFSEFIFLLLNAAAGMMIFSWANDLIVTFIAIEMMSLCLYLLIAMSREGKLSKEAAFKYFILGSLASAVFLYGIAFIYGLSGTTYINSLVQIAPNLMSTSYLFLFGVVFAILGFCFKAAVAPFHTWTPDVYEGAPTPVTALMATGVKLVTFIAFLRFVRGDYILSDETGRVINALQWLAVVTMTVGNIAAIVQSNLKRMLAYSSIAHSGYVLIGIIAAAAGGESWRGDLGVIYYLFSYAVMTLGAFGVVGLFEKREADMVSVEDLKGLGQRSPLTSMVFALFMLSLAGIPPLIGFFGKFFIFSAAIKQGFFWLAVWGAINSVISAYYYLRPIVYMYMKDEEGATVAKQYRLTHAVIALMAVLVVVLGLATEPVYRHVKHAISTLM